MPGWPWTGLCWSCSLEVPADLRSSIYLAGLPLWVRWLAVSLVKSWPIEPPSTESFWGQGRHSSPLYSWAWL